MKLRLFLILHKILFRYVLHTSIFILSIFNHHCLFTRLKADTITRIPCALPTFKSMINTKISLVWLITLPTIFLLWWMNWLFCLYFWFNKCLPDFYCDLLLHFISLFIHISSKWESDLILVEIKVKITFTKLPEVSELEAIPTIEIRLVR